VLIFLLIAAALGLHFMLSYGVVIDDTMMINVMQTDPRETRDLLNTLLFFTLFMHQITASLWAKQALSAWPAGCENRAVSA
jgi:glucan phosphoethanolaminetransferase (alkaline phosphatase superfamily)